MSKSILCIGGQHYPFAEWINNKKVVKVYLTTPEVKSKMDFGELKSYTLVESFSNYGTNNLVEHRAFELNKTYKFTHVVCLAEEDMIRAAVLREIFGIKHGQSYESTLRFRDKVIMKDAVQKAGLKVPNFAVINNAIDLHSFIEKYSYPVVVKPRRGYGSVNTTVIKDSKDLEHFCEKGFGKFTDAPLDLMVESFVTGHMYHVDGFVYNDEVKLIWPSSYVNTVVEFDKNPFIAGYSLQQSNPLTLRIQNYMLACLKALEGPSMYPFHGEVWVTPEDEIVFCEVASRTGGGGIPTQFLTLFGVILSKTHTQYQCEEPITLETKDIEWNKRNPDIPESVGWIFIYPQLGKVTMPKNCVEPYVVSYDQYAESGSVYQNRKSCADAVCNFIVTGKNEVEVKDNLHKVHTWFMKNSKWDPVSNA